MKKIRILHVIGTLHIGGAEAVAMNYFRFIDRKKFTCDYLVYGDEVGEYEEEVYKLGGNVIRIPMPNKGYKEFYKNCVKVFEEGKYDIIHAHTLLNNGIVVKAAKKANIKVRISHSHNTKNRPKETFISLAYAKFMKILIKKYSTNFLACAKDSGIFLFGKKHFDKYGIVINNGINTSNFIFKEDLRNQIRKELDIENKIVIGNIGRFVEQKNQVRLLEIFREILNKEEKSVLLIVGDGELRDVLKKKAIDLGINHAVRFLGTRSDVSNILQGMDVFLFPSIFEGLGIALIEAQASGLMCYASDVIPREAKVSNLIEFISLDKDNFHWSERVLSKLNSYKRKNMESIICDSGYDIKHEVKRLEKVYLQAIENNTEES